jgi:hypothetical protein
VDSPLGQLSRRTRRTTRPGIGPTRSPANRQHLDARVIGAGRYPRGRSPPRRDFSNAQPAASDGRSGGRNFARPIIFRVAGSGPRFPSALPERRVASRRTSP